MGRPRRNSIPTNTAARSGSSSSSRDSEAGGLSIESSTRHGGRRGEVIPCLTGNLAWALGILGYLDDPRLVAARDWICRYQRADDNAASPPSGWPCDGKEPCFGRHSCFMGAVKALASVPPSARLRTEKDKALELAEFMLSHNVFKRSGGLSKVSKPGWLRFGFPLMYQAGVLEHKGEDSKWITARALYALGAP